MRERAHKLRNLIFQNATWFSAFLSAIRYEVNFQNGIECGGAYVKLLSKTPELNLVGTSISLCGHPELSFKNLRGKERKFSKNESKDLLLCC